jgi:hypothetical protein
MGSERGNPELQKRFDSAAKLVCVPRRPKVIQLSTQTEREVTGRMNYSSETVVKPLELARPSFFLLNQVMN